MEIILLFTTFVYCMAVLAVLIIFLKPVKYSTSNREPFISVIIAARNEEKRILPTLQSLANVIYPIEKFEVILIDDRSDDNTAELIESYSKKRKNWSLISIDKKSDFLSGKKNALKKGIDLAQGEIILTTDADCAVPQNWLKETAKVFNENTSMVLGYSLLLKRSDWLDKYLRFDNLFSGIMMAAPALIGFPISSLGRNMAYRRKDYQQSGGYDILAGHKSGDDIHLTELFRKKSEGNILFNLRKESYTRSKSPDGYREVFHQQIRKNSKLLKKSIPSIMLTIFLFLYHVLLVLFPLLIPESVYTWILLLAGKLIIEFATLSVAAIKLADPRIIPFIPIMQVIYPLVVTMLGLLGIFQRYEWK